jgi:hypothetical protein
MSETPDSPLVQRMRLARRVADALVPQEGDVSIVPASAGDMLSAALEESPIRVDFIMTVLDLRLLLALLVNAHAETLDDPQTLKAANALLWDHPESAACVLQMMMLSPAVSSSGAIERPGTHKARSSALSQSTVQCARQLWGT